MIRPWAELERTSRLFDELRQRMELAFNDLGPRFGWRGPSEARLLETGFPRVNIDDAGNALEVSAELPGLRAKDIKLSLDQNVLSLSGEREVRAPKDYAVHRQERRGVRFSRSYTLPCAVDAETATARFKDGVLTVSIEKAIEARPRQIAVKGGQ